jgi:integrase
MALIWDDVDFEKGTLRVERACKWVGGQFKEIGPPKTERSNRVIELEPEHLDLLREQLRVQQEAVETSRKQQSPYGEDRVEDWVKKERPRHAHLYKNTNLIFPKHDGTVPNADTPRRAFNRMVRRAGIGAGRRIRWYDLRHTHATVLLSEGMPPPQVAERLGHSVAELFRTYAHAIKTRLGIPSRVFADLIPV